MRIGIDVGGTNTDAVLLDEMRVLAAVKRPTTSDTAADLSAAVIEVLRVARRGPADLDAVMVGTTRFTNAFAEAEFLAPTGVLRLGLPATTSIPPLSDWPGALRTAIGGTVVLCHGGSEHDGVALASLDEDEVARAARTFAAHDVRSVAITSVFSPVNAQNEVRAAAIVGAHLPGAYVSLSHELGSLGLVERENATVINAAIRGIAAEFVDALAAAVRACGVTAPILISQNDGTLMNVEAARRRPVAMFESGPTNSMRGAAWLSGLDDCVVVDVGGTTSDVGVLVRGFPRERIGVGYIAGVRTNIRMPDIQSLAIGGGSILRGPTPGSGSPGRIELGPDSVAGRITTDALVVGGAITTATDLAVAAGRTRLGDPRLVRGLDRRTVRLALTRAARRIARAADDMRTSPDPLPLVVVGGAGFLVPTAVPGFAEVRRPALHGVANAIGAAIAQIGADVDRVVVVEPGRREEVLARAKAEATARATAAGALPGTVRIVDVEEIPLAYISGGATRIRVKAVGDLDVHRLAAASRSAGFRSLGEPTR